MQFMHNAAATPQGRYGRWLCGLSLLCLAGVAWAAGGQGAAPPGGLADYHFTAPLNASGRAEVSEIIRAGIVLTILSFIPALLICCTSFIRIAISLSMLRHAIGLSDSPPNVVIVLLALFLTGFSMSAVFQEAGDAGVKPFLDGKMALGPAYDHAYKPFREYMLRQTREEDLALIFELEKKDTPEDKKAITILELVPAYMISELRIGFQVGFVIFLPFLLVDLVVATILMALGMMMTPPSTIAIPVKILLFVLMDGWVIVIRAVVGTIV